MEFILGSGQKIPLYCCKENPLTEPSITSNAACTNALEPDLQYNMVITLSSSDTYILIVNFYQTGTVICLKKWHICEEPLLFSNTDNNDKKANIQMKFSNFVLSM